ncbi:hypothetical protein KAR91_33135 [Candidatus Pacearchaeota archaeon]|nr:hypothetical protein [Candidatus Pacearchaeota archaeon]
MTNMIYIPLGKIIQVSEIDGERANTNIGSIETKHLRPLPEILNYLGLDITKFNIYENDGGLLVAQKPSGPVIGSYHNGAWPKTFTVPRLTDTEYDEVKPILSGVYRKRLEDVIIKDDDGYQD